MIEWINKFFGIKNEISVPMLVSLVVVISSGIGTFFLATIRGYFKRRNIRKRFRSLLQQLVENLKIKEKNTLDFSKTITIEHQGGWRYGHKPIGYLEILYLIDFNEIHNAFYRRFIWRPFKLSEQEIAFHRIWDILGNLKFLDGQLDTELNNLSQNFGRFHDDYRTALSNYQEFHQNLMHEIIPKPKPTNNPDLVSYVDAQEEIWLKWGEIDENTRIASHITYSYIVEPIFKLNQKFPAVDYSNQCGKIILDCVHSYAEMLTVLTASKTTFEGVYSSYKKSKGELSKAIDKI